MPLLNLLLASSRRPLSTRRLIPLALCLSLGALASTASAAGWEQVGTKDGVRVARMAVPGSSKLAFRGETVANIHIGKVLQVFGESKSRKYWVDRWKSDRDLDVKSPLERTYWIRFGLPFPVSDRDYVLHTKAEVDATRRIVTARIRSVDHPSKGVDDCCVRGLVASTFYRFEALPGEKTRLTVEVQTDPKGMLPSWLVNLIQKDWPVKTLNGLIAASRRPTVQINANFADWHNPAPAEPAPTPAPAAAPTP